MLQYIHCKMKPQIKLIGIFVTSHSYLFFVVRALEIYSLSKFQVFDTLLLLMYYSIHYIKYSVLVYF